MEFVREKGVHCPSCGRSRGVKLWRNSDQNSFYITCKHCHLMFKIMNMGVWSGHV